ncbi:hypothetical protein Clst_0333 [Thermoclostridium stercorarium subsp. stercorarium DSM 8532]|jgi:hypothetical protein|nr:hypothetical protein [Thermoclostridium stercorarium]AGI38436.1 hypothetical protein Clst_0333 [Thermoclostridium stercorarium subsp. stercorarium DSM 8532]
MADCKYFCFDVAQITVKIYLKGLFSTKGRKRQNQIEVQTVVELYYEV